MSTPAWVLEAKLRVRRAWRKAAALFIREARQDMRKAKRSAYNSGWWSDLQDHWAEEAYRSGERWLERERW